MMGSLLAFFAAGPARIQGLLIGAAALLVLVLALTTWALFERSGKLQLEVQVVSLRDQSQVLADSLGRCNAGVENAATAGAAAVADTKRLLGMAEVAMQKTAALREEARAIVSKAPPARADGKAKDCTDALDEIKAKVRP
jgi:hypothetical protein